jgi:hypothetical protein
MVKVGLTQCLGPRSASQPKPQVRLSGWGKLVHKPSARQRCQPVGHVNYLIRFLYTPFSGTMVRVEREDKPDRDSFP